MYIFCKHISVDWCVGSVYLVGALTDVCEGNPVDLPGHAVGMWILAHDLDCFSVLFL